MVLGGSGRLVLVAKGVHGLISMLDLNTGVPWAKSSVDFSKWLTQMGRLMTDETHASLSSQDEVSPRSGAQLGKIQLERGELPPRALGDRYGDAFFMSDLGLSG